MLGNWLSIVIWSINYDKKMQGALAVQAIGNITLISQKRTKMKSLIREHEFVILNFLKSRVNLFCQCHYAVNCFWKAKKYIKQQENKNDPS